MAVQGEGGVESFDGARRDTGGCRFGAGLLYHGIRAHLADVVPRQKGRSVTVFRILAYLAPLAVGFGVPAAMSLTRGMTVRRRLLWSTSVFGAILLLLAPVALSSGEFVDWLELVVLLASFAALVAGLCLLVESTGLPGETGQIAAGLLTVTLMATVFWYAPILKRQVEQGATAGEIYDRISLILAANPFMTTAYSIFDENILSGGSLYNLHIRDYQFRDPRWGVTALGYVLAGGIFAGLAWAVRAARGRQGLPA